jgi:hypothetical protein
VSEAVFLGSVRMHVVLQVDFRGVGWLALLVVARVVALGYHDATHGGAPVDLHPITIYLFQ